MHDVVRPMVRVVDFELDVQKLCTIVTSLAGIQTKEFEEKGRRSFFGRRGSNHHYVARFDVRTIIGPADLQFELCTSSCQVAKGFEADTHQGSTRGE